MKTFNQFLAEMAGRANPVPLIGSDDPTLPASNTFVGQMEKARAAKLAAQQQAAQAQARAGGAPAVPAGTDAVSPQAAAMAQKMVANQRGKAADAQLPDVFSARKVGNIPPQQAQAQAAAQPDQPQAVPTQAQRLANMGVPVPATPEQLKAGQIDDDLPGGFGAKVGSPPPAPGQPQQAPGVPYANPTPEQPANASINIPDNQAVVNSGKRQPIRPPVPKMAPRKAGPPTRFDRTVGDFVPVDQPPQG